MSYTGPRGTNPDRDANRAGRTHREPGSGGSGRNGGGGGGGGGGFGLDDVNDIFRDVDRTSRSFERATRSTARAWGGLRSWEDQSDTVYYRNAGSAARAQGRYEDIQLRRANTAARAMGYRNYAEYQRAQGGQFQESGQWGQPQAPGMGAPRNTFGFNSGTVAYVAPAAINNVNGTNLPPRDMDDGRNTGASTASTAGNDQGKTDDSSRVADNADARRRVVNTGNDQGGVDDEDRNTGSNRNGGNRGANNRTGNDDDNGRGGNNDVEFPTAAANARAARAARLGRQPAPRFVPPGTHDQWVAIQRMIWNSGDHSIATARHPQGDDGRPGKLTMDALENYIREHNLNIRVRDLNFLRPNEATNTLLTSLREEGGRGGQPDRDRNRDNDQSRDNAADRAADARAAAARAQAAEAQAQAARAQAAETARIEAGIPPVLRGSAFDPRRLGSIEERQELAVRALASSELHELRRSRVRGNEVRIPDIGDMEDKMRETVRWANRRFGMNLQEPRGVNIFSDDAMMALGLRQAEAMGLDVSGRVPVNPFGSPLAGNPEPQGPNNAGVPMDPDMQAALARARATGASNDSIRGGDPVNRGENRDGPLTRNENPQVGRDPNAR